MFVGPYIWLTQESGGDIYASPIYQKCNIFHHSKLQELDYGCFIYSAAKESVLKQVDPVHNSAMRLCTGASRSSPIPSLNVEAQNPPPPPSLPPSGDNSYYFNFTRELYTYPTSLTHHYVAIMSENPLHIGNQIENALQLIDQQTLEVMPFSFDDVPRWILPRELICDGFECPRMSDSSPQLIHNLFLEHVERHHRGDIHIYTY